MCPSFDIGRRQNWDRLTHDFASISAVVRCGWQLGGFHECSEMRQNRDRSALASVKIGTGRRFFGPEYELLGGRFAACRMRGEAPFAALPAGWSHSDQKA